MPETKEYYSQLLADYLNNSCTPQQVEELMQWLQQDAANRVLLQLLQAEFNKAMETDVEVPAELSNRLQARLIMAVQPPPSRSYKLFYRAAAAAILVLMLGAGWFYLQKKGVVKKGSPDTASTRPVQIPKIKKGGAFITLANGEQIELDKIGNGPLSGHDNIIKLANDRITYDTALNPNTGTTYHTLTVPRGIKMMQISLADGTLVWLNTGSSIKYPTSFTGNERRVELTGEAYFDVKHDAAKPFAVRTKDITVNVLGTRFNVSAYDDDEQCNVVLEKGSVALSAKGATGILTKQLVPGNLASFKPGGERIAIAAVNTEEYVSWKMGYLLFKQVPLEQIVKRVSRYYDIQINTSELAHSDETFSGRLDLQNNITAVMDLVCLGTSYIYLPKEQKLALKK
ncbi:MULTISPECIES: FecR domain-containing protein [Niastella]|uniref:FecR domain-containing protein n=1 Tax=Niastella soli TaxID=2821487 RepID=A0ABS3Z179_9BACT|nr:FecR domain-containing protein [Niastella soli]MBO9203859.1 FecR domain-containing protein [Niastella soli]